MFIYGFPYSSLHVFWIVEYDLNTHYSLSRSVDTGLVTFIYTPHSLTHVKDLIWVYYFLNLNSEFFNSLPHNINISSLASNRFSCFLSSNNIGRLKRIYTEPQHILHKHEEQVGKPFKSCSVSIPSFEWKSGLRELNLFFTDLNKRVAK